MLSDHLHRQYNKPVSISAIKFIHLQIFFTFSAFIARALLITDCNKIANKLFIESETIL